MEDFNGITIKELVQEDPDRRKAMEDVHAPQVESWRRMSPVLNTKGQFLWEVRPPGNWVSVLRYDRELISTSAAVPLDIDWAGIYEMLAIHKGVLHARCSPEVGLIAVAAQRPGEPATPLMPQFSAPGSVMSILNLDAKGLEELAEKEPEGWPVGLQMPSIIGMQAVFGLGRPEDDPETLHRAHYLRQYPEGIWLLTSAIGRLHIYEVLS